jgi:trans-2,3-dihydro-3-hydroxyanthranilate isomerase
MRSYRFLHLDVFTDRLFGGNQLAVFLDGRGLKASTMQSIAAEMNFSETTFVLPADRSDTDVRVRIFTPANELPIAGHPTIGTAFALARAGVLEPDRGHVVFSLGVGPTDVALEWTHDDLAFAWMTQPGPVFGRALDRVTAATMLGLTASDVLPEAPVQIVSCGVPYVIVPLGSRAAVDQAVVDPRALHAFAAAHGLDSVAVYLFSMEAGGDGAQAYCRMFAPALGIGEDPATGSAAGPLGCYLLRHGLVTTSAAERLLFRQGVKMNRPSDIHVSIEAAAGGIARVQVGGKAWLTGEGTLYL